MQRPGTNRLWWRSALAALCALLAHDASAGELLTDTRRLTNLIRQDCGGCHGLTLKGGLGKPLTVEHLSQWNEDQLAHIILDGVPGTPMPPWRPLMSEADARWIAGVLKSGSLQ